MNVETQDMRKIKPVAIPGIVPGAVSTVRPEFREVDPSSLLVDATYQRRLTEKSIKLIRKIVAGWDWSAFKPPVTVEVDGSLHVVDGQHTATAASTHPDINLIPVMVVNADETNARASAFVKHNRDRVNVTPMQLHHSLLAAGDEEAMDVDRACTGAGITVLRQPPAMGCFKEGETVAVAAIRALVKRRFIIGARKVLDVCVAAKCAPVGSDTIKAVEALLFDDEYRDQVDPENLARTIRNFTPEMQADVAAFKVGHRVPRWRALAVIYFRNTRKKRRAK